MHCFRLLLLASAAGAAPTGAAWAQEAAQAPPSAPATLAVAPQPFAQWKSDTLQVSGTLMPSRPAAATWWGLNAGATAGAAGAMGVTQAFCRQDDGCVAETIGYSLLGGLLGGALGAGMKY
jgi:hypothetical protein